MAKQSFSIYLLKENFDNNNSIKKEYLGKLNKLKKEDWDSRHVSDGALYLQENEPKPPIWKQYFGINKDINNQIQGAVLFLPISIEHNGETINRFFAITFGYAYHSLMKKSIDYDFGIITTLNSLDPEKSIKAIDSVFPENRKRERVQSPNFTSLTFFEFNKYQSLVKSLQGKVKDEYKSVFDNITGTLSFKCCSAIKLDKLNTLCEDLLKIYFKKDYETNFPELTYIKPVSDPDKINELNKHLVDEIIKGNDVYISIPDIVDPTISIGFRLSGIDDKIEEYDEISFDKYLYYLSQNKFNYQNINLDYLDEHKISYYDINNSNEDIGIYSIYDCISFDVIHNDETYHLCDGNWYKINKDYISYLKDTLDPIFNPKHDILVDYNQNNEGEYNEYIFKNNSSETLCLDKKNISPSGQSAVEPCDIIYNQENYIDLIHVKIDTKSSTLSHLFNQGLNSICLIRSNQEAKDKLKKLLDSNPKITSEFDSKNKKVTYGIITKKDITKASENLPLFSRISLLRCLEQYRLLGVECEVIFIKKSN